MMKKLIVSAIAVLVLAGCGGSSDKAVTKTCTMELMKGVSMGIVLDGKGKDVTGIEMQAIMDPTTLGLDIDALDDATKKQMESQMVQQMGLTGKEAGVTTKLDSSEKEFKVSVKIDLSKADDAVLKKIGLSKDDLGDFDATIKSFEEAKMTCK